MTETENPIRDIVPAGGPLRGKAVPPAPETAVVYRCCLAVSRWPTLAEIEREHIVRTLERTHYNQRVAADLLAIHRQQLARKMKKHGLAGSSRRARPRDSDQR